MRTSDIIHKFTELKQQRTVKHSQKRNTLLKQHAALTDAGAKLIVLEKITEEVSRIITDTIKIPTIGIGAGRFCDGQVLVINDILGIGPPFKHAKRYQDYNHLTFEAICKYQGRGSKWHVPYRCKCLTHPPR